MSKAMTLLKPECFRIGAGADAAADRTGFDQADRLPAGALGRQQAAVRAHHEERAGEALRFEVVVEPADVSAHLRPDVGVGGDRRGALVLVPLAGQIGAEGDVDVGQHALSKFRQPPLRGWGWRRSS